MAVRPIHDFEIQETQIIHATDQMSQEEDNEQNLNEYEKLLSATDDEASLLIIERQILSCYESVVQND